MQQNDGIAKEGSLFMKSVLNHQGLVDKILDFKNEDGICEVSQPELAKLTNHCQTWVSSTIRRLNTEDICIEIVGPGRYVVHYHKILTQGVFHKIMLLMIETVANPSLANERDSVISRQYDVKLKTVQMYKAYAKTGRKKTVS